MSKIEKNLDYFMSNHPDIYKAYQEYGKQIHTEGGPLDEKTRWLIKIAISATRGYAFALQTHINKALAAGCSKEEIKHTILLIAPSVGFPRMMESLLVFREMFEE
jgi:AhpD family alkylhydroperoxidase